VHFFTASATHIPLPDGSVDVILVNGIFNLNPARREIFAELFRVLRKGGKVYGAELILKKALKKPKRFSEKDWFA